MANKIAIFGGSFNPIHLGHLRVASHAMDECSLSKVVFMPNANPPHKDTRDMISSLHRYNMVSLAISGYNRFEISDYEMNRTEPSYTIDTMRAMRNVYSGDISFIIGADSLYTLHKWKSYDKLIGECKFIVADRNCAEGSSLREAADRINLAGGNITLISMPRTDVTSTMIRQHISEGHDVSDLLPKRVYDYILENNLYQGIAEDKR